MCMIAGDVYDFAKFLWSTVHNDVCKGIYVIIRLKSLINCRINQGRISKWKKDFPMDYFHLNNILIQIFSFAYFPFTKVRQKNYFH